METLRDVKCGASVKVVKLHGEGAVKRRIMDMGNPGVCAESCAFRRSGGSDGKGL